MKFTKIAHKPEGKTKLKWTVPNGEDREERKLHSRDEPRQEFIDALQNLRGDFMHIMELPTDYADNVEIRGISMDEDSNGLLGVIISGVVNVAAGTSALSTPRITEPAEDESGTGDTTLQKAQLKRIRQLCEAASAYAKNDREQIDAFQQAEEESEEPAGATS